MINEQSGQSIVETFICLKVFSILILSALLFFYTVYAHQVASHTIYNGLLCVEHISKNTSQCSGAVSLKLKRLLFFHKGIRVKTTSNSFKNSITAEASILGYPVKWQKKIRKR